MRNVPVKVHERRPGTNEVAYVGVKTGPVNKDRMQQQPGAQEGDSVKRFRVPVTVPLS